MYFPFFCLFAFFALQQIPHLQKEVKNRTRIHARKNQRCRSTTAEPKLDTELSSPLIAQVDQVYFSALPEPPVRLDFSDGSPMDIGNKGLECHANAFVVPRLNLLATKQLGSSISSTSNVEDRAQSDSSVAEALKYDESSKVDSTSASKLLLASACGDTQLVESLVRSGVSASCFDQNYRSPLHLASGNGFDSIVRFLLVFSDVQLDAIDTEMNTALHLAIANNREAR